jgi:hypothetical protein
MSRRTWFNFGFLFPAILIGIIIPEALAVFKYAQSPQSDFFITSVSYALFALIPCALYLPFAIANLFILRKKSILIIQKTAWLMPPLLGIYLAAVGYALMHSQQGLYPIDDSGITCVFTFLFCLFLGYGYLLCFTALTRLLQKAGWVKD